MEGESGRTWDRAGVGVDLEAVPWAVQRGGGGRAGCPSWGETRLAVQHRVSLLNRGDRFLAVHQEQRSVEKTPFLGIYIESQSRKFDLSETLLIPH